eukprot:14298647-Ditylum_brightwellii.AAC.1
MMELKDKTKLLRILSDTYPGRSGHCSNEVVIGSKGQLDKSEVANGSDVVHSQDLRYAYR